MKERILLIAAMFINFLTIAQVTDKDGITYKTVTIGTQTWTADNLLTTTFQNGDTIPEAHNLDEWVAASILGKPMFVAWDKSSDMIEYGNLYNWYAVTDKRGFAPIGWHVPTDEEWNTLVNTLGGPAEATVKLKSIDEEFLDWTEFGNDGSDESNFNGFPAGMITNEGYYEDKAFYGYFWSSSEKEGFGQNRNLAYDDSPCESALGHKGNGFSVRCIKDANE